MIIQSQSGTVRTYTSGDYSATTAVSTDQWYNLIYAFNSTHGSYYLQGEYKSTSEKTIALSVSRGDDVYFGNGYNGYFNGSIDEVMIFNRTLSTDEITDIYKAGLRITS